MFFLFHSRPNIYGKIYDFPFGKALNGQKPFCLWLSRAIYFIYTIDSSYKSTKWMLDPRSFASKSLHSLALPAKITIIACWFGMCSLPLTRDCFLQYTNYLLMPIITSRFLFVSVGKHCVNIDKLMWWSEQKQT